MITKVVIIAAAAILPYLWGELSYRMMDWLVPRNDTNGGSEVGESAPPRDVLDFQI